MKAEIYQRIPLIIESELKIMPIISSKKQYEIMIQAQILLIQLLSVLNFLKDHDDYHLLQPSILHLLLLFSYA